MQILIDTNILFPALIFPNSKSAKALLHSAKKQTKQKIRDIKEQHILNAAIASKVDIIITGDKDFLSLDRDSLDIKRPKCMTAAEFLLSCIN